MSAKSNAGWFLLAALAAAACGGEADEGAEAGEEPPAPARVVSLPDTTAEAVWAYLEAQGYASWPRWPGTEALYSGNEPHGMLLTTYVNSPMAEALEGGRTTELPDGAIVVKENYMPDSTLAAVTVMYQAPGNYNEAGNGWWYLKHNADGTVDAAGSAGTMCQGCHEQADGGDYLFTPLPGSM